MGFFQSSSFSQNSTLFFIFFFILTSSQVQGESNWKLIHKDIQMERRNLLIGSRPPRCEKGYCRNCGHCEAVQVPISPRFFRSTSHQALARKIVDSRGDDISNYKPMCWKCKCGDFMFNP
ncbi:hypothetical protein OSB04_025073 [Centaurea solstitialis]|uniref:Epidermal patterning factor-like protein n=1 Tax=Centaurea solstitialis TaxID=347529 RepID=A0AA38SZ22_9ASTR|nr:hypothetical protein OSB04_025073 [Centaurea solstitialis]